MPTKSQRTILVTGCSTGIGWYCANQLKKDGWRVFATARKEEDIARLNDAGLDGLYLDYTDESSIHATAQTVLERCDGKLDALFNNGAYGQPGAVEDLETDVLRQQFEANFFGWHTLTRAIVPAMRKHNSGRIIHCSSVLGFVPFRWRGAYNASKFALEGLASTMRLEMASSGIHVSLVQPGPIESKFTQNGLGYFLKHIDRENSVHAKDYEAQLERLESGGGVNRFRLGPDSVYKKLEHALNSGKPKPNYYVTTPTYIMGWAKRLLPQSRLDKLLLKSG